MRFAYLFSLVLAQPFFAAVSAQEDSEEILKIKEVDALSDFAEFLGQTFQERMLRDSTAARSEELGASLLTGPDEVITPDSGDDAFGDPSDSPSDFDSGSIFISRKSGAADRIAYEVLYQTLNYYGVVHFIEKSPTGRYQFRVIESKSGYFRDLATLDVAFAVREFSRYLVALLCGEPTQENFYKLFAQVPLEEIGFRFKYDMAWALLGNQLPRQPNQIFELGGKWEALNRILSTTKSLEGIDSDSKKELQIWWRSLSDVINLLVKLNKLTCYIDARPNPREELKKRKVIRDLLKLELEFIARNEQGKALLEKAKKEGAKDQIAELRR
jgi:hypothetical protein